VYRAACMQGGRLSLHSWIDTRPLVGGSWSPGGDGDRDGNRRYMTADSSQ
jgi:hypothetical protein